MDGWPLFPIATDTVVSVGEHSAPRSTYPPSQIFALILGSRVAPRTKKLASEGCSPSVWSDDICCRILLSRSWGGSCTDADCCGVNTTGGAGSNVDPLCWGRGGCKAEGKAAEEDEGRGEREDDCWGEDDVAGNDTDCCSCWRSSSFCLFSSAISSIAGLLTPASVSTNRTDGRVFRTERRAPADPPFFPRVALGIAGKKQNKWGSIWWLTSRARMAFIGSVYPNR